MGFTKLFSSILTSTVWCEDDHTRLVWIGMLALSNARGIVDGSIPGLANICRVPVDSVERAIEILASPDKYSRNPENDGRRIEPHPGGWKILNYLNYRDKNQDKDGSRADYYRRYRHNKKTVARNTTQQDNVAQITEAEAEAEAEVNTESFTRPTTPPINLKSNNTNTIPKNHFGEFSNVFLSSDEYQKLIRDYSEQKTKEMIEKLSSAIESKGPKMARKYKSHYATIKNWERNGWMDGKKGGMLW